MILFSVCETENERTKNKINKPSEWHMAIDMRQNLLRSSLLILFQPWDQLNTTRLPLFSLSFLVSREVFHFWYSVLSIVHLWAPLFCAPMLKYQHQQQMQQNKQMNTDNNNLLATCTIRRCFQYNISNFGTIKTKRW